MFGTTQDDFSKNFLFSCVGHIGIILVCLLSGKIAQHIFKNENVEIIRSSVRVDVVGMPKFTIQELKAMQKEAELAPKPVEVQGEKTPTKTEAPDLIKKDDLVIEEATKKKKKSFLNIINDYSAKKVAPKDKKKGDKAGESHDLDSLIVEGNRLSKGSVLVGEYSDEANSEFSAYVQKLPELIRQYWKLPSYLLDKDLRCRIRIHLSPSGHVLKLDLQESSGQPEFDARAEQAVRNAAPFPKPSAEVGSRLTNSGIILGFPL